MILKPGERASENKVPFGLKAWLSLRLIRATDHVCSLAFLMCSSNSGLLNKPTITCKSIKKAKTKLQEVSLTQVSQLSSHNFYHQESSGLFFCPYTGRPRWGSEGRSHSKLWFGCMRTIHLLANRKLLFRLQCALNSRYISYVWDWPCCHSW